MYPSKILLFGEYTILTGSEALAIPYYKYAGEWAFPCGVGKSDLAGSEMSNASLKNLVDYLKKTGKDHTKYIPDIPLFEKELDKGLFFKSNIPPGHGLGSSGAVAAAVLSRYSDAGQKPDLHDLRTSLALIESFYHGTSSGIDPLVSFMKSPIYFQNLEEFEVIASPDHELLTKSGLFIVNTNSLKIKDTKTLVTHFNKKYSSDKLFSGKLKTQYIPVNNKCAQLLTGKSLNDGFFDSMNELTKLQLELFHEMIPEKLIPVMKYGLDSGLFYMKLCGSGGGGFMLGFTSNIPGTIRFFENELIPVEVYGE